MQLQRLSGQASKRAACPLVRSNNARARPAPLAGQHHALPGPAVSSEVLGQVAPLTLAAAPCRRPGRASRALTVTSAAAIELQVTKEELSTCRRRLNITVPAAGVKQCFHKAVDKMRDIVGDLPGFRRDKIPLSMIISNCGGQRNFKLTCIEEVLLTAMPLAMETVIKEEGVVPDTEQVVTPPAELEAGYDPAKAYSFSVEYDTVPALKWKKSYKDISVTIRDVGDFQTDSAAADALVRELLKESGHQSVVAGRGLQEGDTAIVSMKWTEVGSKVPLPGLSSPKTRVDTDMDPLHVTPHLLGAKVGETRTFRVTLPSDYRIELWRDMTCDVEVSIKELFSWSVPELTDEFVAQKYPGRFANAAELRQSLLATTTMERVQVVDAALGDAVRQAVVDCVERPDLPASLVDDMAGTQYRAALLDMIEKKAATPEEVDRLATPELVEEYRDKRRDELEAMVVFNIAADEIWTKEGLTLDDKDVKEEVKARKAQYDAQQVEYDEQAIREQVVDTMKHLQVVEWLKDNVQRTVLPYSDDATAAGGSAGESPREMAGAA